MRKGRNLYKRKDGRWEARVAIGRGPDGRIRYKYLYGDRYKTALQKQKDFEKGIRPQVRIPYKDRTAAFRDIAMLWLEEGREGWKPSTYIRYLNCLEKDILPYWGQMPLCAIGQDEHDQLISRLRPSLSASSLRTVDTVLNGIVRSCQAKRCLEGPPVVFARPPVKERTAPMDILSPDETVRLTQYLCLDPSLPALGILTALYEGIRLGELCALTWGDVDMAGGTIRIRRTLQRIQDPSHRPGSPHTILHLGPPKNGLERYIPLHPLLKYILKDYAGERPRDGYVLRDDRPMEPRNLIYHFKKALKGAGIRDIRFHALRHTFASNCVEAGMDIKVLSEILGHSTVKITLDRYVHLSMRFKQSQIAVLDFPVRHP